MKHQEKLTLEMNTLLESVDKAKKTTEEILKNVNETIKILNKLTKQYTHE